VLAGYWTRCRRRPTSFKKSSGWRGRPFVEGTLVPPADQLQSTQPTDSKFISAVQIYRTFYRCVRHVGHNQGSMCYDTGDDTWSLAPAKATSAAPLVFCLVPREKKTVELEPLQCTSGATIADIDPFVFHSFNISYSNVSGQNGKKQWGTSTYLGILQLRLVVHSSILFFSIVVVLLCFEVAPNACGWPMRRSQG